MKKNAHFKFEIPKIIGVISDRTVPTTIRRRLDSILKRKRLHYVCLPFKVESKHLKNVVACMRLMDISGLVVLGKHSKRIGRFIPRLDGSTGNGRVVNALRRRKNRFHGYCVPSGTAFYADVINLLTAQSPFLSKHTLKASKNR